MTAFEPSQQGQRLLSVHMKNASKEKIFKNASGDTCSEQKWWMLRRCHRVNSSFGTNTHLLMARHFNRWCSTSLAFVWVGWLCLTVVGFVCKNQCNKFWLSEHGRKLATMAPQWGHLPWKWSSTSVFTSLWVHPALTHASDQKPAVPGTILWSTDKFLSSRQKSVKVENRCTRWPISLHRHPFAWILSTELLPLLWLTRTQEESMRDYSLKESLQQTDIIVASFRMNCTIRVGLNSWPQFFRGRKRQELMSTSIHLCGRGSALLVNSVLSSDWIASWIWYHAESYWRFIRSTGN